MSKADDIFWRQFGIVLGLLILFGFVVAFIARSIAGDALQKQVNSPSAIAERIAPVASVRTGDPAQVIAAATPAATAPAAAASGAAAAAPAAGAASDGEQVYAGACQACHQAGVAGAPKTGDVTAWAPRIALGEDALVASVVNGKGAMPPKGGNPTLSEEQIRAAVGFMVGKAGGAVAQAVDTAKEATAAVTGAVAEAADKAKEMTAEATAAATTAMAPAAPEAMPAGKPGDQVYNMACVACHATGAANAPKLNDKAAWEPRVANGIDALVQSAIKGKGAMPPKGGLPSLSDADIGSAVRYMLEQAGVAPGG